MKTGIFLLLVITILIFPSHILFAQYSTIADTIKIDEIVITGTPVKVNRNNIPMAVSVVNKTEIEETDESALLPVLNGKVPGLFVTERGVTGFGVAAGSAGQISIRGIGGSPTTGVLMLIDGHPQFMGIMGHPLPDSYVASDVERVEVIREPASILYGSNAMGGVINIITKKQVIEKLHGSARVSYGSFDTQKYMGSVGYKKNKFSVFVSANHDQTDGHREHSDFKINNGYIKLGYDFNEHFYVSTDLSLSGFEAADPGPDTINANVGQEIDIVRGYWALALQNEFEKFSGSFKLFYNFGEHNITDGFHSTDHNFGLNFYESLHLFEGSNITLGVDYINYGGIAENINAMNGVGIVFADTELHETGIYSFVQQTFGGKLTLNGGLRYQHHSVYGKEWIPSTGFAFKIDKNMTWKGTISKGFRSPTMRELYMWGPQNPDLEPESIINYETGIVAAFLNNKMSAEVTVFAINGDNLINTVPVNGTFTYMNSGEISNKGIEMAVNMEVTEGLTFNATYSYINMKNPVYATPEHQIYFNAKYRIKKIQVVGSIQQIINLDNEPTPVVNSVDYTLVNAKATYTINEYLKFYISGENLLNKSYEVNRYYTMPGTTVFSGISLSF